jgi:hypothetical protein
MPNMLTFRKLSGLYLCHRGANQWHLWLKNTQIPPTIYIYIYIYRLYCLGQWIKQKIRRKSMSHMHVHEVAATASIDLFRN